MSKLVFPGFYEMHPELKQEENSPKDFVNSDDTLRLVAARVENTREELGLKGVVGDLQSIIINVEDNNLENAVDEFLNSTNYVLHEAFRNEVARQIVLKCKDSSDIIIKSNLAQNNMFIDFNINPKSKHIPNTRLEVFVFECFDIKKYVEVQKSRGVLFATENIIENDKYYFIQTLPSTFTGNSIGVIEWKSSQRDYCTNNDRVIEFNDTKSNKIHLKNIGKLDHSATRVRAVDRDSALIEFMELTNYNFAFAIYVNSLNSITNVATLEGAKYAAVFTAGISSYVDEENSGPTEKFIYNYGVRVHHLAFETQDIDYTYSELNKNGCRFLSEVVGSEGKGIKQVFSEGSPNTLLVNEYVCRYGGFTGFFIEENVTLLTKATEKQ